MLFPPATSSTQYGILQSQSLYNFNLQVIGYYILIEHLLLRIFLNIYNIGIRLSVDQICKLNLKLIASIIYISFKGYVDNHTLFLYLADTEDPFRYLFFGTDFINKIAKYDSKWIRHVQTRILKYISNKFIARFYYRSFNIQKIKINFE